jgi:uncharacterized membrane protein
MKNKTEFLTNLKQELTKQQEEIDDVIEYYEELIDERVADGEDEKTVIEKLGDVSEVAKNIKVDRQINTAIKQPTVQNGTKALIAFLGVFSFPLLAPLVILIPLLSMTYLMVIGSLFVAAAVVGVSSVVLVVTLLFKMIVGSAPVYLPILAIGVMLILLPLCYESMRGLTVVVNKSIAGFAGQLRKIQFGKGV